MGILVYSLMTKFMLSLELRKSISEAKGACSKTVKTSKNLEKKTKKGKLTHNNVIE